MSMKIVSCFTTLETVFVGLFSLMFCYCSSHEVPVFIPLFTRNSNKCRSITFSDGITSRKNYENLIIQILNFIIENDTGKVKFIMFHAFDINSINIYINVLSGKSSEIVLANYMQYLYQFLCVQFIGHSTQVLNVLRKLIRLLH